MILATAASMVGKNVSSPAPFILRTTSSTGISRFAPRVSPTAIPPSRSPRTSTVPARGARAEGHPPGPSGLFARGHSIVAARMPGSRTVVDTGRSRDDEPTCNV
jgi:hypothetical protein